MLSEYQLAQIVHNHQLFWKYCDCSYCQNNLGNVQSEIQELLPRATGIVINISNHTKCGLAKVLMSSRQEWWQSKRSTLQISGCVELDNTQC